jgi:hypothetical protein
MQSSPTLAQVVPVRMLLTQKSVQKVLNMLLELVQQTTNVSIMCPFLDGLGK